LAEEFILIPKKELGWLELLIHLTAMTTPKSLSITSNALQQEVQI